MTWGKGQRTKIGVGDVQCFTNKMNPFNISNRPHLLDFLICYGIPFQVAYGKEDMGYPCTQDSIIFHS